MENIMLDNDWDALTHFFPEGWEETAYQMGTFQRSRKFKSPSDFLRVLLIHLADNCSLKETVVRAKYGGIADISGVALMKRMNKASEWLRWMCNQLLLKRGIQILPPSIFAKYNIKSVDASVITEPGSTGTDWRLHYCIELFGLKCDQFFISRQDKGESYTNFSVQPNDLIIGDRAYGRFTGMKYIQDNGAYYLTRYKNMAFTLFDSERKTYKLSEKLKNLKVGQVLEIQSLIGTGSGNIASCRIIVLKKSRQQADLSVRKAIRETKRKQRSVNPETIDYHRYIILLTNLSDDIKAEEILKLYRLRWQIEIAFKHLKSIFGLGHLPKEAEESARAWLYGKMFVALLSQAIVDEGQLFSPWGYPIKSLHD